MTSDLQGNALSGATAKLPPTSTKRWRPSTSIGAIPWQRWINAIEAAPDFAMAHILKAHLLRPSDGAGGDHGSEGDSRKAGRRCACQSGRRPTWQRSTAGRGRMATAAARLDHHNARYPHDLVALQSGHLMDFYRAKRAICADRIARALRNGRRTCRGYSICSACTPSGWRRPATTPVPRRPAAARSTCSRSTAGHTMPSPMSWRCRAAPRTASAG